MNTVKPVIVKEGKTKQMDSKDQLPNQPELDHVRDLFGKLLLVLYRQGVRLDKDLLQELDNYTKH